MIGVAKMANDVVFRRINGRVVPIKKSGTGGKPKALPNYRKPTKTEHNFSRGISAASGVGGLVYTSGKISKFRVDRKVSAINDALSELNLKRPKPFTRTRPQKPNAYGMDDTPLARAMNKRFQKDSKAFLAAKRLSEKRQTEFSSKFARAKTLRFQRRQFSKVGSFLNRRLLPIAIGAGAVAGAVEYFRKD